MHKFIKNIRRNDKFLVFRGKLLVFQRMLLALRGMLFAFLMLALTACTGRENIVLDMDSAGNVQEAKEIQETKEDTLIEGEGLVLPSEETSDTAPSDNAPMKIYVHICGAVVNPGVYELTEGSRVFEGIEAAGGFSEDACEDYVNQAGSLKDGERLVIPTKEEIETARTEGTYKDLWAVAEPETETQEVGASGNGTGLVDINTATESELGSISGIGAGKAAAIVKYRQENGSFTCIEDIMKVSGIKEGTYEKIKDKITVN